jgi:branched-chain amino acid transport system ATP-binding protein
MTLTVQNVSKTFGGLHVLRNVSLSVPSGAMTGIIGPNGAGKSTLFAVIGGSIPADVGTVNFVGTMIGGLSPQERAALGLVRTFQMPRPFAQLTVRDNLAVAAPGQFGETFVGALLGGRRVKAEQNAIDESVDELLRFLNLINVAETPAGKLSGGQRKLLELGRVLMLNCKLILLDEPFAGVNPVLFDEISARLIELNRRGIGLLIIEHNIQALAQLVSDIYVLNDGAILAQGTPDEVLSSEAVQRAYMGDAV